MKLGVVSKMYFQIHMHFRQPEYKVVTSKRNYLHRSGKVEKIHCALKPVPLSINCTSSTHNIQLKKQTYNSKEPMLDSSLKLSSFNFKQNQIFVEAPEEKKSLKPHSC